VAKAVLEAYRAAGIKDPRPEAFLFLEAPGHVVDVNVHPAKAEVRFAEGRVVWTAVERAVRAALSSGARTAPGADASRVKEAVERYVATAPRLGGPIFSEPVPVSAAVAPAVPSALFAAGVPTVLGQHRNCYIVATDGEDIVLVDQHTAHERVRFEALLERLAKRATESQILLAPLVMTLPPGLLPVLDEHADDLLALGFDVEAFGGGSVRVRAVPALLAGRDPGVVLTAILRELLERETAQWAVAGSRDRLAATLACHSAVRAGQPLSADVMATIVRDLTAATHPTMCPHGRPTMARIPREDVSRWFGRSGWRRQ
jgi:DNA mismatch repair protein MutL